MIDRRKNMVVKIKLMATWAVVGLLISGISVFVMQAVSYYKVSDSVAGSLEGYYQISKVVFSFIIVYFIAKLGNKNMMILVLSGISIFCFVTPFFDSIWTIRLFLILMGIVFTVGKVGAYSIGSTVSINKKDYTSFINLLEGTYMFAGAAGIWLYSFFIGTEHWLYVFFIFFALAAIIAIVWLFTKVDESAIQIQSHSAKGNFKELFLLIIVPSVILFLIMMGLYEAVEQGMGTWLPEFYRGTLHLPKHIAARIASLLTFSLAIGRLIGAVVLKKIDWKKFFIVNLIIAFALVLFVLMNVNTAAAKGAESIHDIPYVAYMLPLVGLFVGPMLPTLCSVAISSLPKSKHSIMTSLIIIFGAIEVTICAKITGVLFGRFGGIKAFGFVTLVPFASLIVLIIIFGLITKKKSTAA